jgi:hypothetical protein
MGTLMLSTVVPGFGGFDRLSLSGVGRNLLSIPLRLSLSKPRPVQPLSRETLK